MIHHRSVLYLFGSDALAILTRHGQIWLAGDKIVKTVIFAKDFIGEPHATLAWAGVGMLLPLSS